jgi:hypothetical protein
MTTWRQQQRPDQGHQGRHVKAGSNRVSGSSTGFAFCVVWRILVQRTNFTYDQKNYWYDTANDTVLAQLTFPAGQQRRRDGLF